MGGILKKTAVTTISVLAIGTLGFISYHSKTGLGLRAQLGQASGTFGHALTQYQEGEPGKAITTISPLVVAGYTPALEIVCQIINDYQPIAETLEGCVDELQDRPDRRLASLTEIAIWAQEWDVAANLIEQRKASEDGTAHFDHARFLVLSRPTAPDVPALLEEIALANAAQDPRGQYAFVLSTLNTALQGTLSPVLVETLLRRPSITAADSYFELAKLIQTGVLSSSLSYVDVLSRADYLGNPNAARYLAQFYLSQTVLDPTGELRQQWLSKAAAQGDVVAQYNIALRLLNEGETGTNRAQAIDLLDWSATAGFVPSMTLLGATLYQDPEGFDGTTEEGRAKGIELLNAAAAQGDANAMFNLGSISLSRSEREMGLEYLRKSAALDHAQAIALLSGLNEATK